MGWVVWGISQTDLFLQWTRQDGVSGLGISQTDLLFHQTFQDGWVFWGISQRDLCHRMLQDGVSVLRYLPVPDRSSLSSNSLRWDVCFEVSHKLIFFYIEIFVIECSSMGWVLWVSPSPRKIFPFIERSKMGWVCWGIFLTDLFHRTCQVGVSILRFLPVPEKIFPFIRRSTIVFFVLDDYSPIKTGFKLEAKVQKILFHFY